MHRARPEAALPHVVKFDDSIPELHNLNDNLVLQDHLDRLLLLPDDESYQAAASKKLWTIPIVKLEAAESKHNDEQIIETRHLNLDAKQIFGGFSTFGLYSFGAHRTLLSL